MKFPSFGRKNPGKDAARQLLSSVSAQSRAPLFFQHFNVPDTIDGRFDAVVLHGFLVMRRLKVEGEQGVELAQFLFDALFQSFDDSLREMGVGDLSVGKRIKKMAEAFYGRVDAYETSLAKKDVARLTAAVNRNVFRGEENEAAANIARYMIATASHLEEQDTAALLDGKVSFPEVTAPVSEEPVP